MQHAMPTGYGKSELNVEKKRRALSEAAERRELFMDYRTPASICKHMFVMWACGR